MHAIQCRQVFTVFDRVFGAFENVLYRVVGERVQPQLFDLFDLFRVRESGIVLVVVVQPE